MSVSTACKIASLLKSMLIFCLRFHVSVGYKLVD